MSSLLISLWGLDKWFPLDLTRYQDTSVEVRDHQQKVCHVFLTSDEKWRLSTTVEEVDPHYIQTLLAKEDRFFKWHPGVNFFSLGRALYQWVRAGHVVSGGSTLTMQTIRLLTPRKRSMLSKFIECLRSFQLEWHFSKKEILNIYMTLAPMGGNVEGIRMASFAYFKKEPKVLLPSESAFLVALSQSPARVSKGKTRHLLRDIPHLARRLKAQYPTQKIINTTIELALQKKIENILKTVQGLPLGANVAILVFDPRSQTPRAYVGSQDFWDETHQGQVDYITAYRSPGSTLKPFIYGLALDKGIIQPNSWVNDARFRFGDYAPHNFDKSFHGTVSVKEALATSLNMPAVVLLNAIGTVRFLGLLKEMGITPRMPVDFERPTLAIALGGLGITLEQLVLLYTQLAHPPENGIFVQSAEVITKMLWDPQGYAIKTGTSYGHRDALAIGYQAEYVVGVWIGMPQGESMEGVTGNSAAVPLLHTVFKNITSQPVVFSEKKSKKSYFKLKNLQSTQFEATYSDIKPTLLFPVSGTVIESIRESSGAFKSLPFIVSGGKKPYVWMIDRAPLTTQHWANTFFWTPQTAGYYIVTVMDAMGQTAEAHIEVRGKT